MEHSENKPVEDNATIVRQGHKVFALVTRGRVYAKERVPLHIVDKWDEEKKTWYLIGVAKRLKKQLDRAEAFDRQQLAKAQERYLAKKVLEITETKDGEADSESAPGSEQASLD